MISSNPSLKRRLENRASADNSSLNAPNSGTRLLKRPPSFRFSKEAPIEVSELCLAFLGSRGNVAYTASLLGLMYVGLLAYAQVFTSSVYSETSQWVYTYVISLIFACIVVPVSRT